MKTRLLLTLLPLLLCSLPLFAADQFVTLDSLKGRAETQRAGSDKWQTITVGTKLFNNDIVRVLAKSSARLRFPNGTEMYIHQNSQILINLFENKETSAISKQITVFFGAVYFVLKKTLPQGFTETDDIKVYTPTSVISLRGTSFVVSVDKQSGTTDLQVVSGTVMARNILRNSSLFISAGYKTVIAMNTDPIVPVVLLNSDIDALKLWVTPAVVDGEMADQIARAKRDYYIITGKFENRLIVLPFFNRTNYAGSWDIERQLAELFADKMHKVNDALIIAVDGTTQSDPLVFGKERKARFVIVGAITSFEIAQRAQISVRADEYKEFNTAVVRVHLQVIDVGSSRMVFESDFAGEISARNAESNTWKYISKLSFSMGDSLFARSIIGQAITQSMEQAADKINNYLR